jgi:adenylate cyclase
MLWIQFRDHELLGDLPQRIELLAFDVRLLRTGGPVASKNTMAPVVIVDIDEPSLREHGRFPWSRTKIALMVERLSAAGAAVIAFDIMFSEPEMNPAVEVATGLQGQGEEGTAHLAEELSRFSGLFDSDQRFAETLAGKAVVLGYSFYHQEANQAGALPEPLTLTNQEVLDKTSLIAMPGYNANLPGLAKAASGGGFFSLIPDLDGVVRRAPLVARHQGRLYASLGLEALRQYLLVDSLTLRTNLIKGMETVESLGIEGFGTIPLDAQGQMIVPYQGPQGFFPYISAKDVLAGKLDGAVEGAIVLVGTTAPGLFDLRSTPVQAVYPGVEIHANVIDAILAKRFLRQPAWALGVDFVITVSLGVVMALVLPALAPVMQLLTTLVVTAGLVGLNLVFWRQGLVLALAMPLVLIALLATVNMAYGFLVESKSRRKLKEMFGQYVPPQIVHEMSENPKDYGFEGETRELTVLFADIRGFTTLSESLSAAELKKLLNRYFTPMTRIIFEARGTIDKYVGDMIMAFWGAPLQDEQHAIHAIEAALAMLAETERLKQEFMAEGFPEINIGVGCNTGPMNVGDMGSAYRRSYTVLGDAVNLGSRLEGTTKFYGVKLVVGETTRARAGDHFLYRELDLVKVKGKVLAIRVYEPICRFAEAGEEVLQELAAYHQALADFRARRWQEAREAFLALQLSWPDRAIYRLYLDRVANLAASDPGEEWDGVYERKEK